MFSFIYLYIMKEINVEIRNQAIPSPNDLIELKSEDIVTNVKFNEAELKEYNKDQCVYGPTSKANCKFCSHMCKERYEDFKKRGIKVEYI